MHSSTTTNSPSPECFLVTGALGCIGAWTVHRLARENVQVVAFDVGSDRRRLRLLMDKAALSRVRFVEGDVANAQSLEHALDSHGVTHVIHLAALLHPRFKADPPLGAHVNVMGSVNVFEAVARRRERIARIVYASSIAVYDKSDVADGATVTHQTVGRPSTLYGVFKQAEEAMARVYFSDRGVSSIGLRPAAVFGAGRDDGLSAAPTQAIMAAARGGPFHIPYGGRSHLHYADDLAAIFIAAARSRFEGADAFSIRGTTADMSEIVAAIEEAEPRARGTISFDGPELPLPTDYDGVALEAVIGALPRTSLADATRETLAIFRRSIAAAGAHRG
ncbi:MAG TPA: NAD(P)-dependent oxidoreductase [Ramlibacter sp.]|nr:NAD(P)-dependent oxidoreductase [Ramlibacter sp.]